MVDDRRNNDLEVATRLGKLEGTGEIIMKSIEGLYRKQDEIIKMLGPISQIVTNHEKELDQQNDTNQIFGDEIDKLKGHKNYLYGGISLLVFIITIWSYIH